MCLYSRASRILCRMFGTTLDYNRISLHWFYLVWWRLLEAGEGAACLYHSAGKMARPQGINPGSYSTFADNGYQMLGGPLLAPRNGRLSANSSTCFTLL